MANAIVGTADRGNANIPYGPTQRPWSEQVPARAVVASPVDDPKSVYVSVPPPDVEGDFPRIDYAMFEVPPTGLSDTERAAALEASPTKVLCLTAFQTPHGRPLRDG